jgi:hypothetical protein
MDLIDRRAAALIAMITVNYIIMFAVSVLKKLKKTILVNVRSIVKLILGQLAVRVSCFTVIAGPSNCAFICTV